MSKHKRRYENKGVDKRVDEELKMIDIDKEVPDAEALADVNDDESFDDAFLDALDSIPDEEETDEDGEPVVEPKDELSDEEKYQQDKPIDNDKDDPIKDERFDKSFVKKDNKKLLKKVEKKGKSPILTMLKENAWAIVGLLFLLSISVAGIVIARNGGLTSANNGPLAPIRALQNATDDSFIGITGLKQLDVSNGQAVASIVSWANSSTTSAQLADADFETRLMYALSGAYVEILCEEGYVFIDSDYGVLMIIPDTEALRNADKNGEARTTVWFADLRSEELYLRPADLDAANAQAAVLSGDGIGAFMRAAVKADTSTIETSSNALVTNYGVTVPYPTDISAVKTWGDSMGYAVNNWTVYLSGLGDSAHSGASIFNYILHLDDNTAPIAVVDENGYSAGESRNMMLFNLYGIYVLNDGLDLPDGLKTVTIDETGEWKTEVTEEEWSKLLQDLQAIHATVLNYSGLDAMNGTQQLEDVTVGTEEGVGYVEEEIGSETDGADEEVSEVVED